MTLADDLNTDLSNTFFKDATEFNVLAVFTLKKAGGGKLSLYGLFSDEYTQLDGDGDLSADSNLIEFMVRSSDISNVRRDDSVYIDTTSYTVMMIKPDGLGLTTVMLEKCDVS